MYLIELTDKEERRYTNVSLHKKVARVIEIMIEEDPRILERNISDFVHTAVNDKIESRYILFPDLKEKILSRLAKE